MHIVLLWFGFNRSSQHLCKLFTHIIQGCFTGNGAIIWLPHCLWSNPELYGSIQLVPYDNKARQSVNHVHNSQDVQYTLQWCHTERDGISNQQPHDCLLTCLFRHRSKKTSKLRVIGLCGGNSPVTGEFPAQRASNAEKVSIWWYHHTWE